VLASAIVHGRVDLDTFRPAALRNPEVRALAGRVVAVDDPESDYPLHDPAVVEVTAGGRSWRVRVPFHPGSPEAPMSAERVIDKFVTNAGWLVGPAADEVARGLADYPDRALVSELMASIPRRVEREKEQP
jgi:2-methylcitrate dehydratase PrpD